MQLSVVIPFYQVEKYIGACLDALAALPAEESEILLVDDCGRDGSAAIAAAYCAAHPNARVIRRAQNGGLSAARNTGLDAARGEYVYFLDSDDVLRAEALWRLTQAAREKQLDIAKARLLFERRNGRIDRRRGHLPDRCAGGRGAACGAMPKRDIRADGLAVRVSARVFAGKRPAHGGRTFI